MTCFGQSDCKVTSGQSLMPIVTLAFRGVDGISQRQHTCYELQQSGLADCLPFLYCSGALHFPCMNTCYVCGSPVLTYVQQICPRSGHQSHSASVIRQCDMPITTITGCNDCLQSIAISQAVGAPLTVWTSCWTPLHTCRLNFVGKQNTSGPAVYCMQTSIASLAVHMCETPTSLPAFYYLNSAHASGVTSAYSYTCAQML